jgi:hypothetical protein
VEHKKTDDTGTHLFCDSCWEATTPGFITAARVYTAPEDDCCRCGRFTASRIMVKRPSAEKLDYCYVEN